MKRMARRVGWSWFLEHPSPGVGGDWKGMDEGLCGESVYFCSCFCHAVYEKSWWRFWDFTLLMTPV